MAIYNKRITICSTAWLICPKDFAYTSSVKPERVDDVVLLRRDPLSTTFGGGQSNCRGQPIRGRTRRKSRGVNERQKPGKLT